MILFDLTAVFLLLFLFLFSFANPEYQKYEEQVAPLLVSGDTSTEYDLAPTLREFCRGYGLANFRWDDIMTSIMIFFSNYFFQGVENSLPTYRKSNTTVC